MKKYARLLIPFVIFLISSPNFAQKKNFTPEKGFWQLVSNVQDKKSTMVQFYDDNANLVYEEKVTGIKLNTRNKKTLLHLKVALEKALALWNANRETAYNQDLVINVIKRK